MKLQDICTSLKLSKELESAGYPQESLFVWRKYSLAKKPALYQTPPEGIELGVLSGKLEFEYSAPTASELGEAINDWNRALRFHFIRSTKGGSWFLELEIEAKIPHFKGKSMTDCLAKMWLYLKKNNLLQTKQS